MMDILGDNSQDAAALFEIRAKSVKKVYAQLLQFSGNLNYELFQLAVLISVLKVGTELRYGEWTGEVPKDAAPASIMGIVFKNDSQRTTLGSLLKITCPIDRIGERIHRGAKACGRTKLAQFTDLPSKVAEARARIRSSWPEMDQAGSSLTGKKLFDGRYLPKFHWGQVAYIAVLEDLLSVDKSYQDEVDLGTWSGTSHNVEQVASSPAPQVQLNNPLRASRAAYSMPAALDQNPIDDIGPDAPVDSNAQDAVRRHGDGEHQAAQLPPSPCKTGAQLWKIPDYALDMFGEAAHLVWDEEDFTLLIQMSELDREAILAERRDQETRARTREWALGQQLAGVKRMIFQKDYMRTAGDRVQASTFQNSGVDSPGTSGEPDDPGSHDGGIHTSAGGCRATGGLDGAWNANVAECVSPTGRLTRSKTRGHHGMQACKMPALTQPGLRITRRSMKKRRTHSYVRVLDGEAEADLDMEPGDTETDAAEPEYSSITGSAFLAASPAEIVTVLERYGISLLKLPALRSSVSQEEFQDAVAYGMQGLPIFQGDTNGNVDEVDTSGNPTGFRESDYGTRQRLQNPIPNGKKGHNILRKFRDVAEATMKEVVDALPIPGLHIHEPTILVNIQKKGQKPVGRQGYHIDLKTSEAGLVAVAPVAPVSLLVVPSSHLEVRECVRLRDLVDRCVIPASDLDAWLKSRQFNALRLEMDLGDLLFMTGDTVHAGDCGRDGQPSPRVHWYITDSHMKENATTHLSDIDEGLPSMFK